MPVRSPEEIDQSLRRLKAVWLSQPEMRLGQLIMSVDAAGKNPLYLEDGELLKELQLLMQGSPKR